MNEDAVRRLQRRLASAESSRAWSEFLDAFADRILQVVHRMEWDEERRTDCFVFVCEELARHRGRRLRRFDPARGASFVTWVSLVTRNLCYDWHRKRAGRFRPFRSLAKLTAMEEAVYREVFLGGRPADEAREALLPDFPELTAHRVAEIVERIRRDLTPRQHWLLSVQRPKVVPLARGNPGTDGPAERQIADPSPGPETLAEREERRARLAAALERLPSEERLLVRLRFEQGLSLARVAALVGLGNAQQADRELRRVLESLRQVMGEEGR